MFDFVSDIFYEGNYDEILALVGELTYWAERGENLLLEMTHDIEYTWENEKYDVKCSGNAEIISKKERLEKAVEQYLFDNEISDAASDIYKKLRLEEQDVDYDDFEDDFFDNVIIHYKENSLE